MPVDPNNWTFESELGVFGNSSRWAGQECVRIYRRFGGDEYRELYLSLTIPNAKALHGSLQKALVEKANGS